MLKKLELADAESLFEHLQHEAVFPYVRFREDSLNAYLRVLEKVIAADREGAHIVRVITDNLGFPIGQIALYDIQERMGFLATWLGAPYHGQGFNQAAKKHFLNEVFRESAIETVYMKIRKANEKSLRAAKKTCYAREILDSGHPAYAHPSVTPGYHTVFVIDKKSFHGCL